MINFEPKVGQFMFTNAWLPHSFTKNNSEQPFKFIHFNLGVELLPQQLPDIEVVWTNTAFALINPVGKKDVAQ